MTPSHRTKLIGKVAVVIDKTRALGKTRHEWIMKTAAAIIDTLAVDLVDDVRKTEDDPR